jgi:hypothetical protein
MRKSVIMLLASLIIALPMSALADVNDYLGTNGNPSRCPKLVVIRPEISSKNVFVPVNASEMESASNMIGSAVAGKYDGATVISAKELDKYRPCNTPVLLTKLKSYSTEPAIFGQHEGKADVTILHFTSPSADAPDREVNLSATGERQWGDSLPFMNAIKAVCEKIQKTSLL